MPETAMYSTEEHKGSIMPETWRAPAHPRQINTNVGGPTLDYVLLLRYLEHHMLDALPGNFRAKTHVSKQS